MSSSAQSSPGSTWAEVDNDLDRLAATLDMQQSPREAMFNAALDEFVRDHPELPRIPTWAEAQAGAGGEAL